MLTNIFLGIWAAGMLLTWFYPGWFKGKTTTWNQLIEDMDEYASTNATERAKRIRQFGSMASPIIITCARLVVSSLWMFDLVMYIKKTSYLRYRLMRLKVRRKLA